MGAVLERRRCVKERSLEAYCKYIRRAVDCQESCWRTGHLHSRQIPHLQVTFLFIILFDVFLFIISVPCASNNVKYVVFFFCLICSRVEYPRFMVTFDVFPVA